MTKPISRPRAWLGPLLLLAAPVQYVAGDAILAAHHARPLNLLGALGLLLVLGSLFVLIAGLGETFNLLAQQFARRS